MEAMDLYAPKELWIKFGNSLKSSRDKLPPHLAKPTPIRYYGNRPLVLDFEIDTSYGDYGHPVHKENQMLLACWKFDGETKEVFGNEFQLGELLADLDQCDFLVAHNAKYELGWLKRCGYDISKLLVFDTKIAEYVLFGNMKGDTSLNACCIRRGVAQKDPVVDLMMDRGINPVEMPRKWLAGRCHKDVADTYTIFLDQREALDKSGRLGVLYTRCIFTPVLAAAEHEGMALDAERVMEHYNASLEQEIKYAKELERIADGINFNSPKQVGQYLYEVLKFPRPKNAKGKYIKTESGGDPTDLDTILALPVKTEAQREFKEAYAKWQECSSHLSKYLDFYKGVCEEYGGVFHAEFNQTVTVTHRLSSSGMKLMITDREGERKARGTQFQNQPREYKRFFRAKRPGYLLCEWDGSGLEFRAAGIIGKDTQIRDDINDSNFDPHTRTASVVFKRDYDDLLRCVREGSKEAKSLRTAAKEFTFKPLYGGQSGTPEQQEYYRSFNERYWRLVETQEMWLKKAYNEGVVALPWGMRYYFPHLKMDRSGYISGKTNVFNYPIQGFATAEVIPIAATYFWHHVAARGLGNMIVLVNSVHDSVICEVHPDAVDDYISCTIEAWKDVYIYLSLMYNLNDIEIPFGTEFTIGTHWSEGDSRTFEVFYNEVRET